MSKKISAEEKAAKAQAKAEAKAAKQVEKDAAKAAAKEKKGNKSKKGSKGRGPNQDAKGDPAEPPKNTPVPEEAVIRRPEAAEAATKESSAPQVKGDQRIVVIDNMQKRPVSVFVLEGKNLNPELSGKLVFIQGAVSNEWLPEAEARAKFAMTKDGTVIYNARGFDDVAHADFSMVDIVKLVESNEKNV